MATETEFDGFYAAHFGDTVAMTYGLTADIDEARDITQEAFCRAWKRWQDLSAYDNPVIWVRRVATNLAYSRWRHLRVAATHLVRHRVGEAVAAPPSPDHVTLVAELRRLPRDQRIALVLHHMLDLPVTQVAEFLEVPEGRVKMWLLRGRQTLAAELGEAFRPAALSATAPAGRAIKHGKDRRHIRKAAAKAAAFLLAILTATAASNAVQLMWPVLRPGGRPAPQVLIALPPLPATAVTLSRDVDRITVRWSDPSRGHARPALAWGRMNEEKIRLQSQPGKGATQANIKGLSPTETYCFMVVLVYSADRIVASERACSERTQVH